MQGHLNLVFDNRRRMDNLHGVRSTIVAAFLSLPLLFISFTAFLAIALGAPGLIMLFAGQILISGVTFAIHMVGDFFLKAKLQDYMYVDAENANLVPGSYESGGVVNVTPSYWMVHVIFFLSYLMANAVEVFKADKKQGADWQVSNRRSKSLAIIIVLALSMLTLILTRYIFTGSKLPTSTQFTSGVETPFGTVFGCALGGAIGYGWFKLSQKMGARESDIFGIIQQMAPNAGAPTTCVYTPIA